MLDKNSEIPGAPLASAQGGSGGKAADKKEPVVVKKYANRRLYNTETSTYVTLDDLAAMVKSERDFVVYDAKSGDDLTHSVLTQIIVEQEGRMASGQTMLPIPFLRQLIRFYGDSVGKLVPSYLQVSLDTLTREQGRARDQFTSAFTPQGALDAYHEQARKNLAMFEQAMKMFSPFGANNAAAPTSPVPPTAPDSVLPRPASKTATVAPANEATISHLAFVKPPAETQTKPASPATDQLAEMRAQMASMQAMIEKLAKDRSEK